MKLTTIVAALVMSSPLSVVADAPVELNGVGVGSTLKEALAAFGPTVWSDEDGVKYVEKTIPAPERTLDVTVVVERGRVTRIDLRCRGSRAERAAFVREWSERLSARFQPIGEGDWIVWAAPGRRDPVANLNVYDDQVILQLG
jgi:hypothetical protein